MLKRVRIEVEAGSPDECIAELSKYEHALQVTEAERYGIGDSDVARWFTWGRSVNERSFFNEGLGREITEEIIEFDQGLPGYRARRVVAYKRLDTRPRASAVPPPRVVDHWEDRTSYPSGRGEEGGIQPCVDPTHWCDVPRFEQRGARWTCPECGMTWGGIGEHGDPICLRRGLDGEPVVDSDDPEDAG